jgi:protein-disulfide isomerase
VRVTALTFLALALAACSGSTPTPPAEPARAPAPTAFEVPADDTPPPKPLPGLGDIELGRREAALFGQLVSELYAPCPSQAVSLKQCVEESRACAACRPAARLLATKVKEGITAEQGRGIYKARFGSDLKQIPIADSPARGPAEAVVTIVVFSDFECPHCRHTMPILDRAFERFSPRIRLVHKFYPLRQHFHAEGAARAAIAAQNQGKYWEMERTLFEHQSDLTDADLDKYAKELGLDLKRFRSDMQSERTSKILARDHDDGERAGLTGTPFILVNGREFDNTYFHVDPDLDAWIKLELDLAGITGAAVAR